jgi:beta-barrel assembly-enhancing protease
MSSKAAGQFLIVAGVFGALWFGLAQIDFVKFFNLRGLSQRTEQKIGDIVVKAVEQEKRPVKDVRTQKILNDIAAKLCASAPVPPGKVTVHLVRSAEVNAFALPGNHLVIYTGLISHCDSVEELCGVMGHEIGHIALSHVAKRLGTEIGASVLASIATGAGAETITSVIHTLSSRAFERGQEADADAFSVKTLKKAQIDPDAFAGFMQKMAEMNGDTPEILEWVSTHPDSKKRVAAIREMSLQPGRYQKPVDSTNWQILKNAADDK